MQRFIKGTAATIAIAAGVTGTAQAAEILVTNNIAVSTTWTSDNTYNLQQQIYVLPGATLTIEPGTIVASTTNLGGSLAVARGAQIFVNGTEAAPVIMTSKADMATWVGGDPTTGTWREAANEWGNLTIMGSGYISEDATSGNTPVPSASNTAAMEGLVADFPGDTKVLYGGGNDNDDSGSISYLSLRYGGRVIGLNNELNGLSLGGIGRGTDLHHVEVMNNVDDGFEIWGGTLNVKYFSIWNVGDDSFDCDQGWRGKAQFGLIVQGYSLDAPQGSGVGDNCFETDGAEDSDWQPVTTSVIYNCTVIGQPVDGDHGTAWRDNARVQYRNCIFMDLGEQLVKFDNIDGDGGSGYGHNGTLSWPATWTTNYNAVPPTANDFPSGTYPMNYPAQTSGKLAEVKDSVFFRNLNPSAYTEATARGVLDPANNNVLIPGFNDSDSPVTELTRGAPVVKGGKTMLPVTFLNPTPANEATTSVAAAPNDGFFTPAMYRGAFEPGADAWVCAWTAAAAFGFVDSCDPVAGDAGTPFCFCDGSGTASPCNNDGAAGNGCANSLGAAGANLTATGSNSIGTDDLVLVATGVTNQPGLFFQGENATNGGNGIAFGDGLRCAGMNVIRLVTVVAQGNCAATDGSCGNPIAGSPGSIPNNPKVVAGSPITPGVTKYYQFWYRDPSPSAPCGSSFNLTNAYEVTWSL